MINTRILHISGNQYSPLPSEHHTRRIWDELSKNCDEYHILARGKDMSFSHTVDGNIHLHLVSAFGRRMWVFFFLSWLLPYYIVKYKPTHLVVQCPVMGGLSAALCSVLFRLPLFVELHGAHYFQPARAGLSGIIEHYIYRLFSWPAFSVASKIRSLSEDMSQNLIRVYGAHLSRKVVVIPTRVDLSVFNKVKTKYSVDGPLRIISVGAYTPIKNHISLLEDLNECGIAFTLTLVGAGPLENEYLIKAKQLGLTDQLNIAGQISHSQLATMLPSYDLYIHYSTSEGLSRAILEAMAAGLPVIATRVGYIEGVLENNKNAVVLDQPWRENFIHNMENLSVSENQRQRLGIAARQTIEERFDADRVFELYRNEIVDCIQ